MRARASSLVLALVLAGCVNSKVGKIETDPPQLEVSLGGALRASDVELPMHGAAIVDLGFLDAVEGARWRLISADASGFVHVWQDGKLVSAAQAHHGGATALVVSPEGVPFTAGMDGRVIEWSRDGERLERVLIAQVPASQAEQPGPRPAPRPIIALALASDRLAISDGHWVQVWSREASPRLLWSHHSRAFVSGLVLTRDGSAIAMAMLREEALVRGLAEHPAAEFPDQTRRRGPRSRQDPDEYEVVRMQARVDRPGAQADLVEVHGITSDWAVALEPLAPIDPDMAMPEPGLLIYREVHSPELTRVIGRSVGDRIHLGVRVGVISTPPGPDDLPALEEPSEGLADFAFGRGALAEQPPIGLRLEPYDSLPVAGRRELTIGATYWAAGDEHGQLVVGPREGGALEWLPASEPIELIAGAAHQPYLVSAGLEQPVRIRRWQLASGEQRLVGMILAPSPDPETGVTPPALYPVEVAIDDAGNRIALSSWSFSGARTSELRMFDLAGGSASIVEQNTSPDGVSIALAPSGDALWSGYEGSRARAFAGTPWQASELEMLGRPFVASSGAYLGFASTTKLEIVDRSTAKVVQKYERSAAAVGEFVAAMSSEGVLALVAPIGGGTIERLHPTEGALPPVETFGPVTALAWLTNPDPQGGGDLLVIGQADGSIELLGPADAEPRPLRPAEGGRVWELAAVGGSPGAFVELDEEGLWIHRLRDGASLRVWLASPEPRLSDGKASSVAASGAPGLVVVWRPSIGARACRVFDSTAAGVIAAPGVTVERGEPSLLREFLAGVVACGPVGDAPAPIEPVPW